ncbi:MAG: Eco57I restriction-modification methylase domain-containing protein [Planctomycetota bacterium]
MALSYTANRGLFSDHYLAARLPELPEWGDDHTSLRACLSALLEAKAEALPTLSEAQTEQQLIRPVLDALGWSYETQITFRALGRDYRPDYALFLSDDHQREARGTVSARDEPCGRPYLDKAAALAEAKYWERPLEERRPEDTRDRPRDRGRSPHFQIIDYLRDSGVRWGILTNGRTWRLYLTGAETAEILYYEADLAGILQSGDPDEFKRFCLFFRAEAFVPDEDGRCFLDRLREKSQRYATEVEDSLKERVFDSVVPVIAEGFLHNLREHRGVEVGPDDRETLDRIYGGTLLLLYRLFFLLYAEARDLIAVGEGGGYAARSLGHLKEEIFRAVRDGVSLGTTSTDWWDDLRNLFRIINRGDPGLNVPRYNGGLFAPDGLGDPDIRPAAEFLEENAIADRHLAEAVMLLTRHAETEDDYSHPDLIDFRDLGVRHLGSVYEGLLEFRLNIADTHLVRATEKGKAVWKPADDPAGADKAPGDLYLTNDKRERKATGSYYTPDYIVRYIVENTVGPQIDRLEREYGLAQEIRGSAEERRPWDDILDEVLKDKPEDEACAARELWDGLASDGERRQFLLNQLDGVRPEHGYDPPTRVLELKVLDPALGSGHFLVGALDYVTTRLAAMLNEHADSPVFEGIREDRRKIVESLKRQGIEADEGKLTDENLLRRMVMKRCLYGVDLNPLAVELSKLSLWLHAFTAGAPLSFLDHHVKCGNSLIGSTLEELRREARKAGGLLGLPMEPLKRAVQHMLTVAELSDASFEDVERSREEYWKADARVEGYRAMLDSLTAAHFGLPEAGQVVEFGHDIDLERYRESLEEMEADWRELLQKARAIARERRFFHWEVEFPEVFFERRGQGVAEKPDAGFDAVVGNPPYVRVRTLKEMEDSAVPYYESGAYRSAIHVWDIYMLFLERAETLARVGGFCSFIVPVQTLHQPNSLALRELLLSQGGVYEVVDLGRLSVFEEAIVKTCILVFGPLKATESVQAEVREPQDDSIGDAPVTRVSQHTLESMPERSFKPDLIGNWDLLQALAGVSQPLGHLCYVTFGMRSCAPGVGQGGKDRLVLEDASTPNARPYMEGREIARYSVTWAGRFIDYRPDEMYSPRSPDLFEVDKIVSQSMLSEKRLVAAFDPHHRYVEQSLVCVVPRPAKEQHAPLQVSVLYLLAVMNSNVACFYFARRIIGDSLGGGLIHATPGSQEQIPIRRIFFATPRKQREAQRDELVAAYEQEEPGFRRILEDVEALLPRNNRGEFVAISDSISMGEALEKGYIEQIPDYLDEHAPSGFDADGNPLEHSDVVHDFLAYLAEQMMEMHKERQALWEKIRAAFLNKGVDPDDLSSLSVTKSIRDYVSNARGKAHPTPKQRRMRTYAEQAERVFGCTLDELYEDDEHDYGFEDLPRLGFERFKWLAALRGADPALLDEAWEAVADDVAPLRDVLARIGSGDWYPERDPETGEYDIENIRSTDWLIDQIVYRLYGLTEDEIRLVEGFEPATGTR